MEPYRTETVRMSDRISHRTKEFMLRRIHADVFIDDNWQYIQEVALSSLFFPSASMPLRRRFSLESIHGIRVPISPMETTSLGVARGAK